MTSSVLKVPRKHDSTKDSTCTKICPVLIGLVNSKCNTLIPKSSGDQRFGKNFGRIFQLVDFLWKKKKNYFVSTYLFFTCFITFVSCLWIKIIEGKEKKTFWTNGLALQVGLWEFIKMNDSLQIWLS